jgi:hypothetical protein
VKIHSPVLRLVEIEPLTEQGVQVDPLIQGMYFSQEGQEELLQIQLTMEEQEVVREPVALLTEIMDLRIPEPPVELVELEEVAGMGVLAEITIIPGLLLRPMV